MKKDILDEIIKHQEALISDISKELGTIDSHTDIEEDDAIDPEDLSHHSESEHIAHFMKQQLIKAKADLKYIADKFSKNFDHVQPGAIVYTDKNIFFIGVSSLAFHIGDKTAIGISTHAPIYMMMLNKKAGDTFSFAGISRTIDKIQ
jgi:hypothetical protein